MNQDIDIINIQSSNFIQKPQYKSRLLTPAEITDSLISAWVDLESRALEANAYLSPYFVLPAIKYLEADSKILALFIEKETAGDSELVGVGIFKICKPLRWFPFTFLSMSIGRHSFLSGFLVDSEFAKDVLEVIFNFLSQPKRQWHYLIIKDHAAEGRSAELEKNIAAEAGMKWTTFQRWKRGLLYSTDYGAVGVKKISSGLQKTFRRNIRRLKELGDIQWQLFRGSELTANSIDRFIELENMGWKGQEGTSLASHIKDVLFFKDVVNGFNQVGRVFFTELRLNNHIISSTSNFISGNIGFAFKIGWDVNYANYSPGILNEIKFIECEDKGISQLKYFDSGASDGSYINGIWTGQREMISGVYAITNIGKFFFPLVKFAQKITSKLRGRMVKK